MDENFEPQNELEIALESFRVGLTSKVDFLRMLASSVVLIVPEGPPPKTVSGVLARVTEIKLPRVEIRGELYFPCYTSFRRLPVPTECMGLQFDVLVNVTAGHRIALNPRSDFALEFSGEEAKAVLALKLPPHAVPPPLPPRLGVRLYQPDSLPDALLAALSKLFEPIPQLQRAWLALYQKAEANAPWTWLVMLDLNDAKVFPSVSATIGQTVRRLPRLSHSLEVLRYDDSNVSDYFTRIAPFYTARSR